MQANSTPATKAYQGEFTKAKLQAIQNKLQEEKDKKKKRIAEGVTQTPPLPPDWYKHNLGKWS